MDSKHWMMQYLKYWDGAEDAHPQDDGLGLFGAFDSRVIENFDKYQLLLPIDASTNRIIGGSAPSKYLGRLCGKVPSGKLDTLLESHWLHVDRLSSDDFAASFVARGEAMLGLIGNAMGRDLGRGRGVFLSALQSPRYADRYVEDKVEFDEITAREYEPEPAVGASDPLLPQSLPVSANLFRRDRLEEPPPPQQSGAERPVILEKTTIERPVRRAIQ